MRVSIVSGEDPRILREGTPTEIGENLRELPFNKL